MTEYNCQYLILNKSVPYTGDPQKNGLRKSRILKHYELYRNEAWRLRRRKHHKRNKPGAAQCAQAPGFLCKIHLLFKYFPKSLCDFFTTLLVQMISVRQAVGILHCDRAVVVVDKGYAVFAAGFDFPVEVIDHRAVAEIIAVDIDGFAVCIREGAVGWESR